MVSHRTKKYKSGGGIAASIENLHDMQQSLTEEIAQDPITLYTKAQKYISNIFGGSSTRRRKRHNKRKLKRKQTRRR